MLTVFYDSINSAQSTPKSSASGCRAEPGFHLFPWLLWKGHVIWAEEQSISDKKKTLAVLAMCSAQNICEGCGEKTLARMNFQCQKFYSFASMYSNCQKVNCKPSEITWTWLAFWVEIEILDQKASKHDRYTDSQQRFNFHKSTLSKP